jgi:hypothetical protein
MDDDVNDNNSIDEDEYLIELQLRLNAVKKERINAQMEAKLVDNRVHKLKQDEEKEIKKLNKTKQQANDKINYYKRLVENMKLKEERKRVKDEEIEKKKEHNKKIRYMKSANHINKRNCNDYEMYRSKYKGKYNINNNTITNEELTKRESKWNEVGGLDDNYSKKVEIRDTLKKQLQKEIKERNEIQEQQKKLKEVEQTLLKRLQTTTEIYTQCKSYIIYIMHI